MLKLILLSITPFLTCRPVTIPTSFPILSFPWRSLKNVNQFISLPCSRFKAEVKVHSLPQAYQALHSWPLHLHLLLCSPLSVLATVALLLQTPLGSSLLDFNMAAFLALARPPLYTFSK